VRARLLWLVLAALAGLLLASLFVQQVAIAESARVQTGFLAASVRLAMVFLLCLHVASSMAREFNDKGIELTLSLALPRAGYFFGKLLGFGAAAVLVAELACAALAWVAPHPGLVLWGVSLACELLLVVALTLLCASPSRRSCRRSASLPHSICLHAASGRCASSRLGAVAAASGQRRWLDGGRDGLLLPDLSRFTATTGW
jgi:hypothetical protein